MKRALKAPRALTPALFSALLLLGCVCAPGRVDCDDQCVDVETNPLHCGGCGVRCLSGEVCYQAQCRSGLPVGAPCIDEDGCDDGQFCNGRETCVEGACRQGQSVDCSDPFECTVEICDESIKACLSVPDHQRCVRGQCREFEPGNATGCD
ncbi:MAG: hypothetical protein KC593_06960 [Myxococcales bacterium]|nr:hypothetical protein [Myxococcales bacterium]MCB9627980.1 hypothetical protein [Sandaracinaceae bacterium]